MVVTAFVHVGGGSTHASFGLISSELVGMRDTIIFIYLKMSCSNGPADVSRLVATVLHSSYGPTPPVAIVRPL
jgi:hypothetical protein